MKKLEEFLARVQKDERSRQESLLESFQKQGKLPADNVEAKGITEKLLNFIILNDQPLSVVKMQNFAAWLNTGSHGLVYHPGDKYQRLHYLNYTTECQPN